MAAEPIPAQRDDPSPAGLVCFNLYDVHETLRQHYLQKLREQRLIRSGGGPGPDPMQYQALCACGTECPNLGGWWAASVADALSCYLGHVELELMAQQKRRPEHD